MNVFMKSIISILGILVVGVFLSLWASSLIWPPQFKDLHVMSGELVSVLPCRGVKSKSMTASVNSNNVLNEVTLPCTNELKSLIGLSGQLIEIRTYESNKWLFFNGVDIWFVKVDDRIIYDYGSRYKRTLWVNLAVFVFCSIIAFFGYNIRGVTFTKSSVSK